MKRVTILIGAMTLLGIMNLQASEMKCGSGMMQKSEGTMMEKMNKKGMHKCGPGMMQKMQEKNSTKKMNKCGDGMMKNKLQINRKDESGNKMMLRSECKEKMHKMMRQCQEEMRKGNMQKNNNDMTESTMRKKIDR
ncbi:hypothetical protein [Nitratiruptor sp. YY09-18]|uniref:hypothetical protein n=1 Tax=Nitratiruptor sp. YY09-18 TaxID=2724901 RepID=UPI0019153587|nr:hypothetical protein [Nitratiruptor sp. YY09-18]